MEDGLAELEHLVVVVPGIGGSVLVDDDEEEVWSARVGDLLSIAHGSDRLNVEEHPHYHARGLIKSLRPLPIWSAIRGYESLLTALTDRRTGLPGARPDDGTGECIPDANVVAAGYDFRLGVESAADEINATIKCRLKHLWPRKDQRRGRVVIIAHSMGGLVARQWAGREKNRKLCGAILTLGTPHRGAPKAMDVLANGIKIGPFHDTAPREMLQGWQSMYDLLPTFPAVLDTTGRARTARIPAHLDVDWLKGPATRSLEMHRQMEVWWRDPNWANQELLEPRIGYAHGTLRRATWNGRKIRIDKKPYDGYELGPGWADSDGDGTVPALSALPPERRNLPTNYLVPERHLNLPSAQWVTEWIKTTLKFLPKPVEGIGRPAVLGVDVDPVIPAHAPTPITMRIDGVAEPIDTVVATATLHRPGQPRTMPPILLVRDTDRDCFQAELPPLAPGLWQLTVHAEPVAHDPVTTEVLEVIDVDGS
jgi:pimeloyl-ACP methyl ester carboxylesterase